MSENIEKPDLLFEASWEVCHKVGGIYTVLSTKAKELCKIYGNNLIFIGPDIWSKENPSPYFKESDTLLKGWTESNLMPANVSVRIGRWDIPGNPVTILIKFDGMYADKNATYAEMWEKFKVDSLHAYGDYDEGCAFGVAAAKVIISCTAYLSRHNQKTVAHFDEWTSAMGLLYIKAHAPHIATVFTTHATSIGRSICGNNKPLYDYFRNYHGDQMAAELNMQSKHSLEKAAAHYADCFTTVSLITVDECEQLLEKRPDIVTPNGFEREFVPKGKNFDLARAAAREKLLKVASALTGRKFPADTFLFVTSGRNEYRNKGLDLFIDSVNTLRNQRRVASKRQAIAFIMVPAWSMDARTDLKAHLEGQDTNSNNTPLEDPVITHTLHNYGSDTIYNRLQYLGMHNAESDNLLTIYVPCYLNGNDGIFNKTYYNLLIGMDAAVFASYYEPWGYTPHEGIAFGVPTITTNLAGFGQWILATFTPGFANCGVEVVNRTDSNYYQASLSIATLLNSLIETKSATLKQYSKAAIKTSQKAEWGNFVKYYEEAYQIALNHNQSKKTELTTGFPADKF